MTPAQQAAAGAIQEQARRKFNPGFVQREIPPYCLPRELLHAAIKRHVAADPLSIQDAQIQKSWEDR